MPAGMAPIEAADTVLRMVIRRLPLAFPGLRACRFLGKFTAEGDLGIDIGPMAALPDLKEVHVLAGRGRVRGAERLPSTTAVFCE
ncbi:hypothetical protein B1K54_27720 [Streptomyces sp. fd1-xmd]|nr:hypothetical protein B1K54_27720 [Streptomyces sp. fd1-xmd]